MATQPICIIVAMDAELVHLSALAGDGEAVRTGAWSDLRFTVGHGPVFATRCGIGMVAAAAATERAIDRFHPRAVLNFGCTGAHRRDLLPGDVVIGAACVNHGRVKILPDGSERFDDSGYHIEGELLIPAAVPGDAALLALAERVAQGWSPEPWPIGTASRPPLVTTGVVASADVWTQAPERIERLHLRHASLCEDMEAAAIAQICALHGVPFLTIKDISNNEFMETTDIASWGNFPVAETGKRAAALTYRLLEALSADPAGAS